MRCLIAGILLSFCISCTHSSYLSSGRIPVYIGSRPKHVLKVEAQGKSSFFFWGIVPYEHRIYLDRELSKVGAVSAANLVVEEYQTWQDFLMSCLSMGMFIKKSFKVTAYSEKVVTE